MSRKAETLPPALYELFRVLPKGYGNNMGKMQDLTGKRFGRLQVIGFHSKDKYNHWKWLCKCDCGNERIVHGANLRNGTAISCGCYKKERMGNLNKTHGKKQTRLYNIWAKMKQRCSNKNIIEYRNYGARGISVCKEWSENFECFYNWAIENGYSDDLTLDRENVNGNYEPSNCRWITKKEQNNNKRNNHILEHEGQSHTISEWADITGIDKNTLYARLRYGWSIERTLSEKLHK